MIAEKSNTAQFIIERIAASAGKVGHLSDTLLSQAMLQLESKGFPTNKTEDYKYCNLDAILKKEFKNPEQQFSEAPDIKPYLLADTVTLVVLNGRYSPELSDKVILKGLSITAFDQLKGSEAAQVGSLAEVTSDAFVALNTAFCSGGFKLEIAPNEELQIPLHILYVTTSESEAIVNGRNLIVMGENSSASIIEHYVLAGKGKTFSNYVSEKLVLKNARLNCSTIQEEGVRGYTVNANQVQLENDAHYDNTTITLSGALVRNNHNVVLNGTHCQANLNGLFTSANTQLVDNHTLMDHRMPHCESNEIYKGIISDKSTGVFNGKIFVRRDAQKTNAYQSSKNILLSDDATINTKPQLEIYADDVKCSHGTSTGRIDQEALFYLKARGIGDDSARKLLLASFAQEIINRIEVESLKEKVMLALGQDL